MTLNHGMTCKQNHEKEIRNKEVENAGNPVLQFLFLVSYSFSRNNRIRNKESESIEIVTKSLYSRNSPGDEKSTGE